MSTNYGWSQPKSNWLGVLVRTPRKSENVLNRPVLQQRIAHAFSIAILCFQACAVAWLIFSSSANAQSPQSQPRASSAKPNVKPRQSVEGKKLETQYQRWLPLPTGLPPDAAQLEQLLQRSLPSLPSPAKEADIKRLQDVIKELSDQLPPGLKAKNLDGISNELLSKALEDPEVRKKAEQLVEQYQQNKKADGDSDLAKELDSLKSNAPSSKNSEPPQANSSKPKPKDSLPKSGPPQSNSSGDLQPEASQAVDNKATEGGSDRDKKNGNNDSGQTGKQTTDSLPEDPFGSPQEARPTNPTPSAAQKEMFESMDDFLREAEEAEAKRNAANGSPAKGSSATEPEKSGNDAKNTRGTSPEIKKQLQEKGFGPTLESILEEARKSSQENPNNAANPTEKNTAKANPDRPDRPSVSQPATKPSSPNAPSARPSTSAAPRGSAGTPPAWPTQESIQAANQDASKIANKATPPRQENSWSSWLSKFAEQVMEASATPSTSNDRERSNPTASPTDRPFEFSMPSGWLLLFLAATIVGLVSLWMYRRQSVQATQLAVHSVSQHGDYIKQPELILNRADVVRAFHQLAYRIAHPLETWSTHRRIVNQVSRTSPEIHSPVHVISEVYEQARYLPSDMELSEDQLASVRKAIQACEP
jgi:hypothetical protein